MRKKKLVTERGGERTNPYAMGYKSLVIESTPLSQALTFSSYLPDIAVDVSSSSCSATYSSQWYLPFEDDDTRADPSNIGLR